MGGTWERLIRVAKKALVSVLSGNAVTDEVLSTVFAEVESLLNGRPLAYMGSDVSNPSPLTPFYLLTGRSSVYVPSDILCTEQCTWTKHWQHAQVIVERFWRRWQRELLPTLQRRTKWMMESPNLKVDDVVVIVAPNSPKGQWPLSRIVDVFKGKDGRVRVVNVKTTTGTYKRPITRLTVLESVEKPP
ncbi:hypothetical protein M513_12433 [Trichuris suis]|nr:hypothetical protein M513_12433 [Trichuris suis]